jgi:hypothetical protein
MFGWKIAQTLTLPSAESAANRIADNKNADHPAAAFAPPDALPFSARPQGGAFVTEN